MGERVVAVTTKDTTETFQKRMVHAEKAIAATPAVEMLAKTFGEEHLKVNGNDFEIKIPGSDQRRLGLLREVFQDRNRAQQKMAEVAPPQVVTEKTGSTIMTGGWLPNARDRERAARGED